MMPTKMGIKSTAGFLLSALVLSGQTDLNALKELKYRSIGPFRGGRVDAVAGVSSQPNVYYFGATGGGVWKTTDNGSSWEPITDGQIKTGSGKSCSIWAGAAGSAPAPRERDGGHRTDALTQ